MLALWASPDGERLLVQFPDELVLSDVSGKTRTLALPGGLEDAATGESALSLREMTAAWDRLGTAVAACSTSRCRTFSSSGDLLAEWERPEGGRLLAFAHPQGAVFAVSEDVVLVQGGRRESLGTEIAAASFHPRSGELWTLSRQGRLRSASGFTREELLTGCVGMAHSSDGSYLAAISAGGKLALLDLGSFQEETEQLDLQAEGLWPGPGRLTLRFQNSAKLPVGIWDIETRQLAWAPVEVRQ